MIVRINRYRKNQRGLTLIELLAGLTVSLLILSLTLSLLTFTYKSFQQSKIQQQMQQEANIMIATISNFHQSNGSISINYSSSNKITITSSSESYVFSSESFDYYLSIDQKLLDTAFPEINITDKKHIIEIKLINPEHDLIYETSTQIQKL
jgi:prepilin-type N-terminal cleavage/methylation domain-containing protein